MSSKEKVAEILDADTFMTDSARRVRLADVQPPVRGETGYVQLKVRLKSLIQGREVVIEPVGQDRDGRTLAQVTVGKTSVNTAVQKLISLYCPPRPAT